MAVPGLEGEAFVFVTRLQCVFAFLGVPVARLSGHAANEKTDCA